MSYILTKVSNGDFYLSKLQQLHINVKLIDNLNLGADKGKPDWRCFKDFMAREGPIKKELVIRLLRDAISVLSK